MRTPKPRIVSLLASATEMVCELGCGEYLVGRSHECDFPAGVERLPACTRPRFDVSGDSGEIDRLVKDSARDALSIYEVFDDVLQELQPTHILTQTQCEVCAVSLRDVELSIARKLASRPEIVALDAGSLDGIWDDMRRVAAALGVDGENPIERLRGRMRDLERRARADARRPSVACLEWLEPPMAAGNWVPELVEMANGRNLFGEAGRHSPWMKWEDLVSADPDVIVAMPCGFDIARTLSEMRWLTERPEYGGLNAAREGRIYVADGNQYFNRSGPRMVESLEILVEILHPAGAARMAGSGWVKFDSRGFGTRSTE